LEYGCCHLPHVAHHIMKAEWAIRSAMGSDLVRSKGARLHAIRDIDIRVFRTQRITVREHAGIGASRGALPFVAPAQPGAGQSARAFATREPVEILLYIVFREPGDWQFAPVLFPGGALACRIYQRVAIPGTQ